MDVVSPCYKKKTIKYFKENNESLVLAYFPTITSDFMVIEKILGIAKHDWFAKSNIHRLILRKRYLYV